MDDSFERAGTIAVRCVADSVVGHVQPPPPPPPPPPSSYTFVKGKNCYRGHGGVDIDHDGVAAGTPKGCQERCDADLDCSCVTYKPDGALCWKRAKCKPSKFDTDPDYDVYVKGGVTT